MYHGIIVKTHYAQYTENGITYPAYCLDKTKQGVNDSITYTVSIQEKISDVKLWRIIINAYPYKTIEELGCKDKGEAYTATKQAIYCYIHGNNPNDYSGIGEAGKRTVNALHKILNDAENCTDTQISNTLQIIKEYQNFKIDDKEKEYVSKIYSIKAGTKINKYSIDIEKIEKELPEGIKITDINNNSKKEFEQNEKFKILIPIKNMTQDVDFNISIKTKINNKPVLYGKAPNSSNQDYALTGATYENAYGKTTDKLYKNETKLKIIKQDKETEERLENVEFNILNENKDIIFANVKTDSNGEINIKNLIPGKYYIQETNTKSGYLLNNELIEFKLDLNQELTLIINNLFEKQPDKEIIEKEITKTIENKKENEVKEISQKNIETTIKKLPVTGM